MGFILGDQNTPNTLKYKYTNTYLLSDLNNFCNPVPEQVFPSIFKYRLNTQFAEPGITNGVSNILIFNRMLSLEEINYLSGFTQQQIINMFPKNN